MVDLIKPTQHASQPTPKVFGAPESFGKNAGYSDGEFGNVFQSMGSELAEDVAGTLADNKSIRTGDEESAHQELSVDGETGLLPSRSNVDEQAMVEIPERDEQATLLTQSNMIGIQQGAEADKVPGDMLFEGPARQASEEKASLAMPLQARVTSLQTNFDNGSGDLDRANEITLGVVKTEVLSENSGIAPETVVAGLLAVSESEAAASQLLAAHDPQGVALQSGKAVFDLKPEELVNSSGNLGELASPAADKSLMSNTMLGVADIHLRPAHDLDPGANGPDATPVSVSSPKFVPASSSALSFQTAEDSLGAVQNRVGSTGLPALSNETWNPEGYSETGTTATSNRLLPSATLASADWPGPGKSTMSIFNGSAAPPTPSAVPAIGALSSEAEIAPLGLFPEPTAAKPEASVTTLTQPTHRPLLDRSMVVHIVQTSPQPGQPSVEITLNPEELGRVRMSLSSGDRVISVTLTAERMETIDLLRRYATELSQEYQSLGYQNVDLHFQQHGQKQSEAGAHDRPKLEHSQPETPEIPSQIHAVSLNQTGVDIRV